jgi:signal transduction histidine kinase
VDDEIAHLARVFNQMLARIEQAFEQLRRFTSDASHELRTPLAAIRGVGEVALQKNLGAGEYRDVIGSMLEEVGRLTLLTESLLTISRAEAGQIPLHLSEFPALQLAQETGGLLEVLAEEKSQELSISGDPGAVVSGDRILVRQALVNILHNAVRHTPLGGRISVTVDMRRVFLTASTARTIPVRRNRVAPDWVSPSRSGRWKPNAAN